MVQESNEKEQKFEVTIDEPVVEEKPEIDLSGLTAKEREMAEKHGIKETEKPKDGEHKVDSSDAAKDVVEEKGKEEVKKVPTFEEVESDEKNLESYNPNEKALYWKWKNDKRKRQDSQKKVDELQARLELETVKDRASAIKLNKLKNILATDTELTVDKLLAIIDDSSVVHEEQNDQPLKRSDLDKIEQEKQAKLEEESNKQKEQRERLAIAEKIGLSKYSNFNDLVELAKEVVAEDKTGTYQEILDKALNDSDYDEEKLIDRVVTIAKLSSKYGKESASAEKKEKVEKIIDNSKKKVSSASLSSSGGRRTIVEDDLTVEDAARLTSDQWVRLSAQTRKRILGG